MFFKILRANIWRKWPNLICDQLLGASRPIRSYAHGLKRGPGRFAPAGTKFREVRFFDPVRDFLFIGRFSWNLQGTSEIHWTVSDAIFSMVGLLLLELLRIFYFREFLILRANIWWKWPNLICRGRINTAHLWSKFGENPSSRFWDMTRDAQTDGQTDGRTNTLTVVTARNLI